MLSGTPRWSMILLLEISHEPCKLDSYGNDLKLTKRYIDCRGNITAYHNTFSFTIYGWGNTNSSVEAFCFKTQGSLSHSINGLSQAHGLRHKFIYSHGHFREVSWCRTLSSPSFERGSRLIASKSIVDINPYCEGVSGVVASVARNCSHLAYVTIRKQAKTKAINFTYFRIPLRLLLQKVMCAVTYLLDKRHYFSKCCPQSLKCIEVEVDSEALLCLCSILSFSLSLSSIVWTNRA